MKHLTLDTNCLLSLDNKEPGHEYIQKIQNHKYHTERFDVCVVVTTASENLLNNINPYEAFQALLKRTGFGYCQILKPTGTYNLNLWNKAVYATPDDIQLEDMIWKILFPGKNSEYPKPGSPESVKKWKNRMCDCQMLHSHIKYAGDIFITQDNNYFKQSKIEKLIALGAGAITHPSKFIFP